MGEFNESSSAPLLQTPPTRPLPFREDCWSEEATSTLVDAWGRRYLELNRGNLRQKDWQEVADAVNARHGHTKKTRRTDVQCKNRIDTLKKKYKIEKAKIAESNETLISSWPFFTRLDDLIGSNLKNQPSQKVLPLVNSYSQSPLSLPSPPMGIPLYNKKPPQLLPPAPLAVVEPVVLPQKRQFSAVDDSYFRNNYSAMAAAAAAAAEDVEEDEEEDEGTEEDEEEEEVEEREEGTAGEEGMRQLAKAIERFGEIYERVENMKQRQMVELEKQRMQFAKDLEVQRMQLFMDTQVQLEKIKQAKRSGSDDLYS
ncbi:hypothetical protein ACH5RR_015315 [Cinchona calisaya]|uniref:Myb/SANT-like DNA-binding domain-containing protein n=1 Tax=Cinchona calisaya TaxID=153742 RepID=A0ABD2ZSS5_9GENT